MQNLAFFFSILVFVFAHLSSWFRMPCTVFCSPEPFQLLVLIMIFLTVQKYIWSIFYSTRQISFLSFFIVVSISSFLPDRYWRMCTLFENVNKQNPAIQSKFCHIYFFQCILLQCSMLKVYLDNHENVRQ